MSTQDWVCNPATDEHLNCGHTATVKNVGQKAADPFSKEKMEAAEKKNATVVDQDALLEKLKEKGGDE